MAAPWIKPCPVCGTELDLLVLIAHDGARETLKIALELPAPLDRLAVQYVFLFKPAKRHLSADRFADLLGEVLAMVKAGEIKRGGMIHPAPPEILAEAIRKMLDRRDSLRLPLDSHGYLLEIIAGMGAVFERSASTALAPVEDRPRRTLTSKTAQGLAALERMKSRGQ